MSAELLQRIKTHIVDDGGLLSGFTVKYYRWSDDDLNGTGSVALFKTSGTYGPSGHVDQWPDVSLYLLADPDKTKAADDAMLAVVRYLRNNYTTDDVFNIHPVGGYTGPMYLANGRAMFELVMRCGVTDH